MFGRLVDMATRTLIIDLSKGTGGEPMYGMVTVQRTRATSEGTFEVLPWETKLKLFNGVATITEAVTDGSGPFYDSAYLIRVQNGYCAPRWGFMAALPDGTTPISTGDMPKVNPITGEGIYMDAQEWNALYGELPDRVSATETRLGVLDGQGQRGYTVDQTAGRVIKVWDYLNNREQLIYGDTGWKTATLINGWTGTAQYRRELNRITIKFRNMVGTAATSTSFVNLPLGYRSLVLRLPVQIGATAYYAGFNSSGDVFIPTNVPNDSYWSEVSYTTDNVWPVA